MTLVASPPLEFPHTESVIILGTDTLDAARPATPVQLAHACAAAGYRQVIPASWGDELIAHAMATRVAARADTPVIQCSCPLVAYRLLGSGADLRPFLVSLVPPPVALARYLERTQPNTRLRITYAGRCHGAVDDSIAVHVTPEGLLASLDEAGIDLAAQPLVFDSVVPPDRRRYWSVPGGAPGDGAIALFGGRTVVTMESEDFPVALTQLLLAGDPVVIDASRSVGCHCAGLRNGAVGAHATGQEPPRASSPVVVETDDLALDWPLPAAPRGPADLLPGLRNATPAAAPAPQRLSPVESLPVARSAPSPTPPSAFPAAPRRRSGDSARPVLGSAPVARDSGGRQLPRTYVARRRTPAPMRNDAVVAHARRSTIPVRGVGADAAGAPHAVVDPQEWRRRLLAASVIVVLGATVAAMMFIAAR